MALPTITHASRIPGRVFIAGDFSQIRQLVAACLGGSREGHFGGVPLGYSTASLKLRFSIIVVSVFIAGVFKPWIVTSSRRRHEFGTITRTEPDSQSAALFDVNDVGVNPADLWRVRKPYMEFLTRSDDRIGDHNCSADAHVQKSGPCDP